VQKGIYVPFSLKPLDSKFVGPKPIESAPENLLRELEKRGDLVITRKRNGHAAYVAIAGSAASDIGLYTRGIGNITNHFPSIVEEVRSLQLPVGTLLAGELVIAIDSVDEPSMMTRFTLSKPARSIALQKEMQTQCSLALYNVIAFREKMVLELPFRSRWEILEQVLATPLPQVTMVEVLRMPLARAKQRSIASQWEGLVLYDRNAISAYRLDGKIDLVPRPYGCWKWKEYMESDFVAYGWVPSTASSHFGQVRDVLIGQYDPKKHTMVHWGKVGKGLSKKDRSTYMDDSLYPMVFEIKFERRTPNNRLINARIVRRRLDKKPIECIGPQ
jgi:ATP-dependent DNA ligase